MTSLSKVIEDKINNIPFLRENLSEGLINTSALARILKPELEERFNKVIKESTIIMSIGRLPLAKNISIQKKLANVIDNIGDLIVRSNLVKYNLNNYKGISKDQSVFLQKSENITDSFYTVSRGINETTILINSQMVKLLESEMENKSILSKTENLSAITMKLPEDNVETEGVYYFILKKLAWKNVTIEEVVSTTNEFTIVVKSDLISKAFDVLVNLKSIL
jgi:hypothetical protein